MRKHIKGIDHVVLAVHDLDLAAETFRRLGFTLTPRGYHDFGSQNHCVMFGDDYIEIVAVPKPHPFNQYYTDFLVRGEGLAATALKSDDAAAAAREFAAAGLAPSGPLQLSRPVQIDEIARQARFALVGLPPEATPGHRMFVCQHLTRDLVWRAEWQSHENGAVRLAAVAIADEMPAVAAVPYQRIFSSAATAITEGLLVETGDMPLAFASADALAKKLPGVWITGRPEPAAVALFIHVADRDVAEQVLQQGGFECLRMPDGSVAVGATEAHGVAMVFG
jgi:hypothetical protein